jgi:hypothetical protein
MWASRRSRSTPRRPKPACCPTRGHCPQHAEWARETRARLEKQRHLTRGNSDILAELVDVWGVCSIWSDSLYSIGSYEKFEEEL